MVTIAALPFIKPARTTKRADPTSVYFFLSANTTSSNSPSILAFESLVASPCAAHRNADLTSPTAQEGIHAL